VYQELESGIGNRRRRNWESEVARQNKEDYGFFRTHYEVSFCVSRQKGSSGTEVQKGAGGGISIFEAYSFLKLSALPDLRNCLYERIGT